MAKKIFAAFLLIYSVLYVIVFSNPLTIITKIY